MSALTFHIKRTGQGVRGAIVMRRNDGKPPVTAIAHAATKGEALKQAADIASRIANNPVLQAALPPGTLPILRGVRGLAKAAMSRKGRAYLRALKSKAPHTVARLAHALHL